MACRGERLQRGRAERLAQVSAAPCRGLIPALLGRHRGEAVRRELGGDVVAERAVHDRGAGRAGLARAPQRRAGADPARELQDRSAGYLHSRKNLSNRTDGTMVMRRRCSNTADNIPEQAHPS